MHTYVCIYTGCKGLRRRGPQRRRVTGRRRVGREEEVELLRAEGDALAEEVREARAAALPVVLVHETDENKGGAPLDRLQSACAAEVAGFICHPYSGVAQPQAARIARVVAEGLTSLHNPASARLASPDTAETASPRSTPRPSSAFSCPGNIKEEHSEEEGSMETGSASAPLDLSKR